MPSDSYHDSHIEKLLDPKYSSLYIETALEETIKDGDMCAFKRALSNVLEAAHKRKEPVIEVFLERQGVYQKLYDQESLTIAAAMAELEKVGIIPEVETIEVSLATS